MPACRRCWLVTDSGDDLGVIRFEGCAGFAASVDGLGTPLTAAKLLNEPIATSAVSGLNGLWKLLGSALCKS